MRNAGMKTVCLSALVAFFGIGASDSLQAQTYRPGSKAAKAAAAKATAATPRQVLKVRQERVIGRKTLVQTPEFRSSVPRTGGRPLEWSKIEVEYDTAPKWIDLLTVKFHVMTVETVDGKPAYSIFRETVDYLDIAQGRGHLAAAYLRPRTVERYGVPAVVHIEFLVAGEVVDQVDELDPSMRNQIKADWYKNDAVLQSEFVKVRDGYLLDRASTPFDLVNSDTHEVIR
jgi:hypothetical protein